MKTLKELAQEALLVQNACNLSGVVKSFDRAIADLKAHYPNMSTNEFNALPILVLWADKIASLTGAQNMTFSHMSMNYETVEKLAHE